LEEYFRRFKRGLDQPLGCTLKSLATAFKGLSFAEAEEFAADVHRQMVLRGPEAKLGEVVRTRLRQWRARYSPK
jgi:hypothetical protein